MKKTGNMRRLRRIPDKFDLMKLRKVSPRSW
jgi:hypothetical protein